MLDYKELGLKCGLEIHQQLDTKNKLFCNCSTTMKEKNVIMVVKRKQHPVPSELGEVDIAAQYEYLRDRTFNYQVFPREVCLICLDEEPPREVNREALKIAIEIALLFNCKIPNEIHVMRKTITDGSNTTSFQRTMVVGLNGWFKYKGKKVEITHVCLEEDAAAIVKEENGNIFYRLNRLGVPLVEISTGILGGFSPKEIGEIAYHIGMTCRSTGKVKRGIGSIRQDVNVSIEKGQRVEIKGVQELGLLPKVIENEVRRQLTLISLIEKMKRKGYKRIASQPVEVTKIFLETECRVIKNVIEKNGKVFGLKLIGMKGMLKKELCPGKTLGKELNDFVLAFGVGGMIHSDEDLLKYGLNKEFEKLKEILKVDENDAIVIIAEEKTEGKVSKLLAERCNNLLRGLEKETRAANPDGTTRYIRPLPGAARLYPETDVPPIVIRKSFVENIKKGLPEPWTEKIKRLEKKYALPKQLAIQIFESPYFETFEKIVSSYKVVPTVVASFFVSILKDLKRRENVEIENLREEHFLQIFEYLSKGKIVKEALPRIVKFLTEFPQKNVEESIRKLGLEPLDGESLRKIIKEEIEKNPGLPKEKLLGVIMKRVRERAKIEDVKRILEKMV